MAVATENVSYGRQTLILDPEVAASTHITIAGCGTVGSNAAHQLVRAGFKRFHVIDMDVVEPHNMPSQAFSIDALGKNKAVALSEELPLIADGLEIEVQDFELMGGEQFKSGIVISCVDSMEMRKLLFEMSAKGNREISLWMDYRMGGNTLKAYAFDPSDERRCGQYEKTLYSAEEAEPVECGGRTFAPVGALSGAFITQMVTKHLRENDHPPYYTEMDFDRFNVVTVGLPKLED